jgi:hypothetical protein
VIEKSINSIVRKSTHGWIEEHGGGLYSRLRVREVTAGLASCWVAQLRLRRPTGAWSESNGG